MKAAVKGTNLFHTSCQIWQDAEGRYYVIACHRYYDDNYDSIEEFEFLADGVTAEGELVDSGFSQGNVSAREDQIVDHGSVAELILRGWGNLFPTIEIEVV